MLQCRDRSGGRLARWPGVLFAASVAAMRGLSVVSEFVGGCSGRWCACPIEVCGLLLLAAAAATRELWVAVRQWL